MRFLRLIENYKEQLFVKNEKDIISLPRLKNKHSFMDITDSLDLIRRDIMRGEYYSYSTGNMHFSSLVDKSSKIICIGLNYSAHIQETKREVPKYPVLFSKFSNSLAAHKDKIKIIQDGLKIDYEGELGVMIGKRAFMVNEEDSLKYVLGYFIGNDISSRELQYRTSQFLLGKTLDNFYPNGPELVTSDEIDDPQNLDIKTIVNGAVRQDSNTGQMIFPVRKLISYISNYIPLEPGDIISTGTPDGVIAGMPENERKWLSPGETVKVQIERIGELENYFI